MSGGCETCSFFAALVMFLLPPRDKIMKLFVNHLIKNSRVILCFPGIFRLQKPNDNINYTLFAEKVQPVQRAARMRL
jgi:hypothetical protein